MTGSAVKSLGYLTSTVSVILLGVVSWRSASEDGLILLCLVGGMLASVLGMALRWLSYRIDQGKNSIDGKPHRSA